MVQSTTGWCSPAIANVKGNVSVKCIGVSPEALDVLNKQLKTSNLKAQERLVEANHWAARYHELLGELRGASDSDSIRLKRLIEQGQFERAESILKLSIERRTRHLDTLQRSLAADHARLGDVFYLERKVPQAAEEYRQAYVLSGNDSEYALTYGAMLISQRKFDEAAHLIRDTIGLITRKSDPLSERESFQLYQALIELASCDDFSNRVEDALDSSQKALGIITALMTQGDKYEKDYLNAVVTTAQMHTRLNRTASSVKLLEQELPRVEQLPTNKDTIRERAMFYLNYAQNPAS
jgi:tetratricopeptide (TPR) repeat protein